MSGAVILCPTTGQLLTVRECLSHTHQHISTSAHQHISRAAYVRPLPALRHCFCLNLTASNVIKYQYSAWSPKAGQTEYDIHQHIAIYSLPHESFGNETYIIMAKIDFFIYIHIRIFIIFGKSFAWLIVESNIFRVRLLETRPSSTLYNHAHLEHNLRSRDRC